MNPATPPRSTPLGAKQPDTGMPSPEEIQKFVDSQQGAPPPTAHNLNTKPEEPVTFGTSEKAVEFIDKKLSGELDQMPEPDIPLDPTVMQGSPADTAREGLLGAPGLGPPVPVSEAETEAFIKSTLFDTPFILDIPVWGGRAVVQVRTLRHVSHDNLLSWWTQYLEKEKRIASVSQMLTFYQRAMVLLRVVSMRGADSPSATFVYQANHTEIDTAMDAMDTDAEAMQKAVLALDSFVTNEYRKMSPARFESIVEAVRLHERKFNALARKAASGNL